MALVNTTLAGAIGPSDTLISLTSGTGWPAVGAFNNGYGLPVQIDGEVMFLVSMVSTTSARVRGRGSEGTQAMAHDVLAPVSIGASGADFPIVPVGTSGQRPPQVDNLLAIGQNAGTLTLPDKNTEYVITKATAATMTLPAPTVPQNGLKLIFTSQTAAAHVLTATALLNNGLTGSPFTTATFAAFPGASLSLVANNGLWNVLASPVTGSTVVLT
jgi:hypothetical protein